MRLSLFSIPLFSFLLTHGVTSREPFDELCEEEPPAKRLKSSCYFSIPRSEEIPRDDKFKVSTGCEGIHHSMADLAQNHGGVLFGAPHELALVRAGGEGVFMDADSDLSQWEHEAICQKHLNELSRHLGRKEAHLPNSQQRETGSKCASCAYPEVHSAKGTRTMSYQKSYKLLLAKNILVPPGTPLCPRHYNEKYVVTSLAPTSSTTPAPPNDFAAPDIPLTSDSDNWGAADFSYAQGAIPGAPMSDSSDLEDSCYEDDGDADPRTEMKSYLKQFLKAADIKRAFCNKKYKDLSEKTQKEKLRTLRQILKAVIGLIVDSEEDQELLLSQFIDLLIGKTPRDENAILHALLTGLADDFKQLHKYNEKVQLLSVFAPHVKYAVLFRYIPDLAERMYSEAKRRGLNPEKKEPDPTKRSRFSRLKLTYFISFITSPHSIIGMPWGEQRTKDSYGRTVTLPNTVRLMGIYETIERYETWMRQSGLESLILSRSTTYKILSKLPSLRSSSQTCVDYFQASATMGFISIRAMLKELSDMNLLDESEAATIKHAIDEIQVYLRTDFKLHVKEESRISDHCMQHALSDPEDKRFASEPKNAHEHDRKCQMCEKMDYIFSDIKKKVQKMVDEATAGNEMRLLDIQHEFDISIEKILDLKSHQVRTVFTSIERDNLIRGLQEGEAFVTLDFAQKWLPSFYRETQKDFFGKPGYSWHISHVYANVSAELVQHVYVHIFKNEVQNGAVVVEAIKHMAEDLEKMGIQKLHLRSDNAGYYHSAPVMASIPAIAAKFSINIASWSFSEAQSGKSSSDRYCSYCKTKMRIFMCKEQNIDTHEKMFEALTTGKLLRGVSVHLGTVTHEELPKTTIKGISKLGHFEFNGDTISAWRFRGIGSGMQVKGLKGIDSSIVFHNQGGGKLSRDGLKDEDKQKIAQGEEPHFWFFPKKHTSVEPDDVDDEAVSGKAPVIDLTPSSPLFMCRECTASFIKHSNLLRHIDTGKHKIRPEKVSQFDFALGTYKRMLEEVQQGVGIGPLAESFKEFEQASVHPKPMGWALRSTKKGVKYNPKAKQLVTDLFEDYFKHAKKLRAEEAEKKMKERTDILPADRMSHEQIKNLIRSLVAAKKKEMENSGVKSRRRRALLDDMALDLEEEGGQIEEEVEVDEADREITADAIYDLVLSDLAEFFNDPTNVEESDPMIGNIDE